MVLTRTIALSGGWLLLPSLASKNNSKNNKRVLTIDQTVQRNDKELRYFVLNTLKEPDPFDYLIFIYLFTYLIFNA